MHGIIVEVYRGRGLTQPWRFRARATNGEVVTTSEGYFSKWNAKRAARRVFPSAPVTVVDA